MTETDTAAAAAPAAAGPTDALPPQTPPPWWGQPPPPPKKKSRAKKIITYFCVLTFILSVLVNIYLVAIIRMMADSPMAESMLKKGAEDQVVAVYEIGGLIDARTAANFETFFRLLPGRKNIKAVVIRVDSPGGYVGPSDQICKMVGRIRKEYELPVVISMGGVAASGGYYVSAPANIIVAEPTTITASIGVIMQFPVLADWLEEHKLKVVTIRSSQSKSYKAAINYFENPDDKIIDERRKLLDHIHKKFVKVVKEGRGKVKTRPDPEGSKTQTFPFNGKVLTSTEAMDVGLVDKIGYLDDAIKEAAKLAKLEDPTVIRFARARGVLARMLSSTEIQMPQGIETRLLDRFLNPRPMMIWEGP